jgi:hypothetical protein
LHCGGAGVLSPGPESHHGENESAGGSSDEQTSDSIQAAHCFSL